MMDLRAQAKSCYVYMFRVMRNTSVFVPMGILQNKKGRLYFQYS